MELKKLDGAFTVCQIPTPQSADLSRPFTFLSVTDDEVSLVCPSETVPADATRREDGWRALKITGVLDFSLVGIIARISAILAENAISLFVVSTFNTDYVLIKQASFVAALSRLAAAGYALV